LQKINPSGYQESQGDFSQRFAAEMEKRLQIPCEVQILEQKDFTEPLLRLNTDRLDPASLDWNEKIAWDELANYYLTHLKTCPSAL
jgi:UDP-glucose 4-epimerase